MSDVLFGIDQRVDYDAPPSIEEASSELGLSKASDLIGSSSTCDTMFNERNMFTKVTQRIDNKGIKKAEDFVSEITQSNTRSQGFYETS